jgi:hypothetical protein
MTESITLWMFAARLPEPASVAREVSPTAAIDASIVSSRCRSSSSRASRRTSTSS